MDKKSCNVVLEEKNVKENGTFSGYASVFNIIDNQNDIIMPGAFIDCLKDKKDSIKLLWQHNTAEPIGKITQIEEDKFGLYMSGELSLELQRGKEAYIMLKKNIVNSLSIGYNTVKYKIDSQTGMRFLEKINLWEISLVTFPSNVHSQVTQVKNNSNEITLLESIVSRTEKAMTELKNSINVKY